jgi:hypothetical protein
MMDLENRQPEPAADALSGPSGRRRYTPPRFTPCGDVRGMTLGGSQGLNDSGPVQPTQPPA